MPLDETHDLTFRKADELDVEAIADAHRDSIRTLGASFYRPDVALEWERAVATDLYLEAMARGEVFFIATGTVDQQAVVLGFASDYPIEGTTHGTSAYVRGAASRRGIGSGLLSRAEAYGRAHGARKIRIEASLGAVEFYRKHGFVEIERGAIPLPSGFLMPCVFMKKDL